MFARINKTVYNLKCSRYPFYKCSNYTWMAGNTLLRNGQQFTNKYRLSHRCVGRCRISFYRIFLLNLSCPLVQCVSDHKKQPSQQHFFIFMCVNRSDLLMVLLTTRQKFDHRCLYLCVVNIAIEIIFYTYEQF